MGSLVHHDSWYKEMLGAGRQVSGQWGATTLVGFKERCDMMDQSLSGLAMEGGLKGKHCGEAEAGAVDRRRQSR